MAKQHNEVEYADREALDSELNAAINEILSAEEEARRIIAKAEASVKATQLDVATRERTLREQSALSATARREKAITEAAARAEADAQKLAEDAEKRGTELFESKRKAIDARASELFKELRGK